jgi:hypothetical protein
MENWQKMAEIQKETLTTVYKDMSKKSKSNLDVNEVVKNMFTNPFEVFNTFNKGTESTLKNSKEILEKHEVPQSFHRLSRSNERHDGRSYYQCQDYYWRK